MAAAVNHPLSGMFESSDHYQTRSHGWGGTVQTCGILAYLWAITLPRQPGDNEQTETSCDSASSLMSRRICFRFINLAGITKIRMTITVSQEVHVYIAIAAQLLPLFGITDLLLDKGFDEEAPVTFPSRKRKCKFGLRISSASVIFGDGSLQRNTWRHCTHREDEV